VGGLRRQFLHVVPCGCAFTRNSSFASLLCFFDGVFDLSIQVLFDRPSRRSYRRAERGATRPVQTERLRKKKPFASAFVPRFRSVVPYRRLSVFPTAASASRSPSSSTYAGAHHAARGPRGRSTGQASRGHPHACVGRRSQALQRRRHVVRWLVVSLRTRSGCGGCVSERIGAF